VTDMKARIKQLRLHGVLARWDELGAEPWVERLVSIEEDERQRQSMERRVKQARLGRFKAIADFDWAWPDAIDRAQVLELLKLRFVASATNAILVGPNGVGKTMLCKNLGYAAVAAGHTVRFTTASDLLNDLGGQDSSRSLRSAVRRYCQPRMLIIDELGYLSHTNRAADLLFEVINGRYEQRSTIISTNRPFSEWNDVFPSATCVVTLVDRLVHHSEIVKIDGASYRLKEAQDAEQRRVAGRRTGP
jgi:DNA replication protein DnaC